jgi:hypothetical protein
VKLDEPQGFGQISNDPTGKKLLWPWHQNLPRLHEMGNHFVTSRIENAAAIIADTDTREKMQVLDVPD